MQRTTGKWLWIPDRPYAKAPFDWQEREPVTDAMRAVICSAWKQYDNSDASGDAITHEEAVLARYAQQRLAALGAENLALRTVIDAILRSLEQNGLDSFASTIRVTLDCMPKEPAEPT